MESIKLTCKCGAMLETSSSLNNRFMSEQVEKFNNLHKPCRGKSPITVSPTMAVPLAVEISVTPSSKPEPSAATETESTDQKTRLSARLRGALTAAELTHVEQCSSCMAQLVQLWSLLATHVQAAHGIISTSPSLASKQFAEEGGLAPLPSRKWLVTRSGAGHLGLRSQDEEGEFICFDPRCGKRTAPDLHGAREGEVFWSEG